MSSSRQSESSRPGLLDRLRNQIRQFETANRMDDGIGVSSGCPAIDRLLPGGGYSRGALVQWLTAGGQGASYLSLLAAKQACADGGALVVFDWQNQFYPPAAAAIGINLDHLIVLRAENRDGKNLNTGYPDAHSPSLTNDLLWSIDQSLRCPAVAAVWGRLGPINETWFRRFQLSAESSGCLGFLVQPICESRQPSWAEVQWLVGSAHSSQSHSSQSHSHQSHSHQSHSQSPLRSASSLQTHEVRLQLTRCRGASTGKSVNLSINTITGSVQSARREHGQHLRGPQKDSLPVVSQLGNSAAGRQRA